MAHITRIAHTHFLLPPLHYNAGGWLQQLEQHSCSVVVTSPLQKCPHPGKSDDSQGYLLQMDLIGTFMSLLMFLEFSWEAAWIQYTYSILL